MSLMNIYSKPGNKIRYAYPKHGMKHDQEQCAALLEKDKVYTVKSCRVYEAHTSVVLEEVPGQTFNSVMFADEPSEHAWTGADDIMELGGLSADERDQLATDLQREQEAATDADLLREQSQATVKRWYDPGNDVPDAIERHLEREHVTDGSPCWCGPTIEDYRGGTVDPDAVVPGVEATTGLSLQTPITTTSLSALTFYELRTANVARCTEVFHSVDAWTPERWSNAMAGECGEVCNAIKKLNRVDDGTNTDKDPQTAVECLPLIADELADLVIYADLLAARLGIDLDYAIRSKFNRVSVVRGATQRL